MSDKNLQTPPSSPEIVADFGVVRESDRENFSRATVQDGIPPPMVSATAPEPAPPKPQAPPQPAGGADEGVQQD